MRSSDVIQLYDIVGWGARVSIVNEPLEAMFRAIASGGSADAQCRPS